jgi:crotonobetainyl-CoA:carnitine CoA-transferase CaiB-like acyl-CoA transferase
VPGHPTLRLAAAPAQFDDRLPAHDRPAPGLGEHSSEILTELGYTNGQITELADAGAVMLGDG